MPNSTHYYVPRDFTDLFNARLEEKGFQGNLLTQIKNYFKKHRHGSQPRRNNRTFLRMFDEIDYNPVRGGTTLDFVSYTHRLLEEIPGMIQLQAVLDVYDALVSVHATIQLEMNTRNFQDEYYVQITEKEFIVARVNNKTMKEILVNNHPDKPLMLVPATHPLITQTREVGINIPANNKIWVHNKPSSSKVMPITLICEMTSPALYTHQLSKMGA